jgi:hypothetical protein
LKPSEGCFAPFKGTTKPVEVEIIFWSSGQAGKHERGSQRKTGGSGALVELASSEVQKDIYANAVEDLLMCSVVQKSLM